MVRHTYRQIIPPHFYLHEQLRADNTGTDGRNWLVRIKLIRFFKRQTIFSNRHPNDDLMVIEATKWLETLHFLKKSLMSTVKSGFEITRDNSLHPVRQAMCQSTCQAILGLRVEGNCWDNSVCFFDLQSADRISISYGQWTIKATSQNEFRLNYNTSLNFQSI